ncbi:CpsD/CapB family tyrosine-protein kinase [Neobacillus niacini]|uniref:CpsD/CapB family tyrosine-protein kinase n=1 Tax=Neobacillus niacini TaxID=86668 RepID=UPI0021CB631E|nr:CpsD/CapB family tyrosine-protein kinase [Neobacillus niacini]MCM3765945.1 CpsD/CapB family tyrosine-protein kinase [Neobacillus niacini]
MKRSLKNKVKDAVNLAPYNNPGQPITEQYRMIRTNIQFSAVDQDIKTILITSPEPGDGKSTTAANLAIMLAQQEKRVLLVDADLRKPTVHYTFRVSNIEGLTSILTKKISRDEAISKTFIPNLHILTSGPRPPNPSEMLDSKAMETLMVELKSLFDFVVFDAPPVMAVTDPQIIAAKCDGVVMVVSSKKTNRDRAVKAKEMLEKVKSRILGVVVNRVVVKKNEYSYYY